MKKLNGIIFILSLITFLSCGSQKKEEKKSESGSETKKQDQSEPVNEEEVNWMICNDW